MGIVVNNLKGSLSAAQKNGAEVVEKPKKVSGGYGTFAVIRDAEKAPLMLIQPGKTPVGGTKVPGAWIWTELWTDDAETAAQFYENVVGVAHQATIAAASRITSSPRRAWPGPESSRFRTSSKESNPAGRPMWAWMISQQP